MVALTRLVGAFVRWLTRSRRSKIATVVVPVLVVIAFLAPRSLGTGSDSRVAGSAGSGSAGTAGPATSATPALAPTVLPPATGQVSGPVVPSRGPVPLGAGPAAAATGYTIAVNSHDARPGADTGPLDSYRRARPYVTADVYSKITAPSTRGDYEWSQWSAARARVTVRVLHAAVPDGAPAPSAATAYVRVQYQQVVTPATVGVAPQTIDGALVMIVTRERGGTWLVSQLLAGT